jgi:hypothetical protein
MRAFRAGWTCSALAILLFAEACAVLSDNDIVVVTVIKGGTGNGTIESDALGFAPGSCFAPSTTLCHSSFEDAGEGGTFTVTATPVQGSAFISWDGCTGTSGQVCSLTFNDDTSFTIFATFDAVPTSPPFGVNLLMNPGFEAADVMVGAPPTVVGVWQGDAAGRVTTDQGVVPRTGSQMLKFTASGLVPGAGFFTSQQWQTVDLTAYGSQIDAGNVRLNAELWVNRVAGDAGTDRRFDLRVLAFPGSPSTFPTDYPPPDPQIRAATTASTALSWQALQVQFDVLPAGTRYVAVEIYPFEDVEDDGVAPEFDGHYADDASLVLTLLP